MRIRKTKDMLVAENKALVKAAAAGIDKIAELTDANKRLKENGVRHSFIDSALRRIVSAVQAEPSRAAARGKDGSMCRGPTKASYPYIPLEDDAFIGALCKVRDHLKSRGRQMRRKAFVDVGCGIGTKLFYAAAMGFSPYGVELDTKMVRKANLIFGIKILKRIHGNFFPGSTYSPVVIHQNAMKHTYGRYDII